MALWLHAAPGPTGPGALHPAHPPPGGCGGASQITIYTRRERGCERARLRFFIFGWELKKAFFWRSRISFFQFPPKYEKA